MTPTFAPELRARGQQYPSVVVQQFVILVTRTGVALRGAANTLLWFHCIVRIWESTPDWTTGRWWLLRIGLAALWAPKVQADDWVWMLDHSIQIGQCKCLVILGIRSSELPIGRALCHDDMQLIGLEPMIDSTKHAVDKCLEKAVEQTGAPCAILSDHGSDLHGGVELFRVRHPETIELYDVKHKAACLLKAQLEHDDRWRSFASSAGSAKCAMQQTELACLVPPSQRSKARFMNLHPLVRWGHKTLHLLDDPAALQQQGISPERAENKLGWLREYGPALDEWMQCHLVISKTLDLVRTKGIHPQAGSELEKALPAQMGPAAQLRERLVAFITDQASPLRPYQRLPGTTEVLESCFGKLKSLERDQSKSGFTGMVLALGAMVSKLTVETVNAALEKVRGRDVIDWCCRNLGVSVQSQRCQLYGAGEGATETG